MFKTFFKEGQSVLCKVTKEELLESNIPENGEETAIEFRRSKDNHIVEVFPEKRTAIVQINYPKSNKQKKGYSRIILPLAVLKRTE